MGRKSIPILLKATSPEGETKMFTSIDEAAKELGFSECGVGKAFNEKRNRIGEFELEWLEPKPDVDPKLDVDPRAAKRIERLKKTFTRTVCIYYGGLLTREDRVKNGFGISQLSEKTGYPIEDHKVNSIYEAHKITGLSASSLINAADKGNAIITRRKDKQRFILYWQSIHKRCFQIMKLKKKVKKGG